MVNNRILPARSWYERARSALCEDDMDIAFSNSAKVSSDILHNQVEEELVLLDLNTEKYFGLDETGTAFWKAVTGSPTIEDAYQELLATYEVEPEQLRTDLKNLLQELINQGLLEMVPSQ